MATDSGSNPMPPTAVTLGDVMVDYLIDLADEGILDWPNKAEGPFQVSRAYFRPIDIKVRGFGVMFAEYAREEGFEHSWLIGAVGCGNGGGSEPDLAGRMALQALENTGVKPLIWRDPERETGKCAIIYLSEKERVLVGEQGANEGFARSSLDALDLGVVSEADVLYVSGYFLRDERRREAAQEVMRLARRGDAVVIVDIVPHEIFDTVPVDEYLSWIPDATALMATNPTMHEMVGLDKKRATWHDPGTIITASDLAPLRERFELLVSVLNSKSDYLVLTAEEEVTLRVPHVSRRVSGTRDAGKALARILVSYLRHGRSLAELGRQSEPVVHG